jgi:hypothetical protein
MNVYLKDIKRMTLIVLCSLSPALSRMYLAISVVLLCLLVFLNRLAPHLAPEITFSTTTPTAANLVQQFVAQESHQLTWLQNATCGMKRGLEHVVPMQLV